MDTFSQRKAAALAELSSPTPDKSPKGGVDAPIIPLLTHLNSHPSFFTTSSCSGRISILLSNPNKSPHGEGSEFNNKKKKAGGGRWLFVSHDKADPEVITGLLFGDVKEEDEGFEAVLRFEPMILAVDCRDLESARRLVSLAVSSGFRESGITSVQKRIMISIRSSIRMEVPLGQIGNLLISTDYVKYLIRIANDKMEANKRRTDGFFLTLQSKLIPAEIHTDSIGTSTNGHNGEILKLEDSICEEEASEEPEDSKRFISDASKSEENDSLTASILTLTGEPTEKLFLWGQSACQYDNNNNNDNNNNIIIFGGFGGLGRHARQNYSLILDPKSGALNALNAAGLPCERMGHTISLVGQDLYLIGGRAGPSQILNDVWVLVQNALKWVKLDCTGDFFNPRHRHAATVVGSKIYVFGGINNEEIYSCMNILNTQTLQWEEVKINGDWPSPRHSHTIVAHKSNLYLFGGHNGNKPLGDFYSFDTETLIWKKEKTVGKPPFARFSHSMFAFNDYIGVFGGCPFRQQEHQEMVILKINEKVWTNLKINSVGKFNMWVRSSAVVINEELFIIGGGASCYAFGTKFNPPMKIDLSILKKLESFRDLNANNFVFRVEKKFAKETKDLLKKFGWLDLNRKVKVAQNGCFVIFPVIRVFRDLFNSEGLDCKTELNWRAELEILVSFEGVLENDESIVNKKGSKSPQNLMRELIKPLLEKNEMPLELLDQIPTRWEQLGDMVILPKTCFKDPFWDSISDQLWPLVAKSLGTQRLARQGRILPNGTRDSTLELLVGSDGWVTHHENGIFYSLDSTKCMFSWGNRSEKIRIGSLNCRDEIVVDLFAGIGYFTLPFLVKAKAKLVYACEWNPNALIALRRNVSDNFVSDRCVILEGDNRLTAPKGVADRVCLGLLPSSECSWITAVKALRREGGILHVHGNVIDSEEQSWLDYVVKSIISISSNEGLYWDVSVQHVERVKWYGPHIRHLVADVSCKRI
ncbi:hypothetical protein LUZ60_014016 [Juncus effusus]|nr:hypothetical protein LUZ60_014016 [Juncus effusus]